MTLDLYINRVFIEEGDTFVGVLVNSSERHVVAGIEYHPFGFPVQFDWADIVSSDGDALEVSSYEELPQKKYEKLYRAAANVWPEVHRKMLREVPVTLMRFDKGSDYYRPYIGWKTFSVRDDGLYAKYQHVKYTLKEHEDLIEVTAPLSPQIVSVSFLTISAREQIVRMRSKAFLALGLGMHVSKTLQWASSAQQMNDIVLPVLVYPQDVQLDGPYSAVVKKVYIPKPSAYKGIWGAGREYREYILRLPHVYWDPDRAERAIETALQGEGKEV